MRLADGQPAFRSTVGFAHYDTLEDWDSTGLGIALHQYHYYAQNNSPVPAHDASRHHPVFVGEMATAVEREWPELLEGRLPQTISRRLELLEQKGYSTALLWSARANDPATRWTGADRDDTLVFLNRTGSDET